MSLSNEMHGKKIAHYLPLDLTGQCIVRYVYPKDEECFIYDSEYFGGHSENWVVVRKKPQGEILRVINTRDISEIEFREEVE